MPYPWPVSYWFFVNVRMCCRGSRSSTFDSVNPSASTSSLLSSDSRSTGTPELDTVFDPTETIGSEEGTTMHVLVGTQWKLQDLNEVLPTLRSLKVSGRSGI